MLITAAAVTLLFKKLKQPVVLGYLIAGFLVGPHATFLPSVSDTQSITIWAEIGVIFLLFGLGLEFSFKKLTAVGKTAGITASVEILFMVGLGYLTGQILGWSKMDSLFLGAILSISSTTIIVRAFEELGLKGRGFVSIVFGALIVEDLLAILLLVLLTSVAATQTLSGSELMLSSFRLVFFLLLWFLLGIYLLPSILGRLRPLLSDESRLIVSIGLCLMMVIVATHSGFSPALGAFVMGSLLAETREGQKIEHLILPVKDLFGAVFFVSVGMLIDPKILSEHFTTIVIITFITIGGKLFSTSLGALLSGSSLKNSVQAGMSLSQIGEFSFIIATLGMSLKVTSDFLYPIAVAVSAVTTFTTPYFIKYSGNFSSWLDKHLPRRMKDALTRYEALMAAGTGKNVYALIWREYGVKIVLNAVIVVGITMAVRKLALPKVDDFVSPGAARLVACVVALVLSGPFLWAIFLGRPSHAVDYQGETLQRLRRLQVGVSVLKFLVGSILAGFVVSQFTSVLAYSGVVLVMAAALGAFFFSRFSEPLYRALEKRFLSNLTENEREALAKQQAKSPELAPWNAILAEFVLSPNSPLLAKTLQESGLKEQYGVTITMIERGGKRILAPHRDDLLLPYDKLFLIGTDEQLAAAREAIEAKAPENASEVPETFGLTSLVILPTDRFIEKPIRDCGLREAVNGLIVGVERGGQRILNPDSSLSLKAGDLVWIVGDRSRIKALRKDASVN